jgi:hypothetical protein
MVLKNVGLDRSIKIGGGREGALKPSREPEKEEILQVEEAEEGVREKIQLQTAEVPVEPRPEVRVDKKRDRKRHYRKRKGREDRELEEKENGAEPSLPSLEEEIIDISPPKATGEIIQEGAPLTSNLFSSLLQPPPTLISETIRRYRQNELFKGAFYLTEEEQYKPHDQVQDLLNEDEEEEAPVLEEPVFGGEALEAEQLEESQEEPFAEQMEQPEIAMPIEEEQTFLEEKQPPLGDFQEIVEGTLPLYVEEERVVSEEDVIEEEPEQESKEPTIEPFQEQKEENDSSPLDGPVH